MALQKQLIRNMRIQDPAAVQTVLYGLMTAGLAYTAKQAINANTDRLNSVDIMKGAFSLSNMTGIIPMMSDPLAEMLGLRDLKFHNYARGVDAGIIGVPAAFPTLNRMAHIPGAILNFDGYVEGNDPRAPGVWSNSDIRAMQATPIIGNLYGFTAMFNAMKN